MKYGYSTWYSFCVHEWGTKWDIGGEIIDCMMVDENAIVISFQSAWSPPIEGYKRLHALGFEIEAYYYEMGMCFCGSWINGEDKYFDVPSTSAECRELLPPDLDDMFNITSGVEEWEEDIKDSE